MLYSYPKHLRDLDLVLTSAVDFIEFFLFLYYITELMSILFYMISFFYSFNFFCRPLSFFRDKIKNLKKKA
jgi:hypothetical protein